MVGLWNWFHTALRINLEHSYMDPRTLRDHICVCFFAFISCSSLPFSIPTIPQDLCTISFLCLEGCLLESSSVFVLGFRFKCHLLMKAFPGHLMEQCLCLLPVTLFSVILFLLLPGNNYFTFVLFILLLTHCLSYLTGLWAPQKWRIVLILLISASLVTRIMPGTW